MALCVEIFTDFISQQRNDVKVIILVTNRQFVLC